MSPKRYKQRFLSKKYIKTGIRCFSPDKEEKRGKNAGKRRKFQLSFFGAKMKTKREERKKKEGSAMAISQKEKERILRNWTEELDRESMECAGSLYYGLQAARKEIKEGLGKDAYRELMKTAEYVSRRSSWDMDDEGFSDMREKLDSIADFGRKTMFGLRGERLVDAKAFIEMADTASGGCSMCIDKIRRMRGKTKNLDRIMADGFKVR